MHFDQSLPRVGTLLCVLCVTIGCHQQPAKDTTKQKPAKVESHPTEVDIYRIVLTPEAEKRLQISTVAAEMRSVPRSQVLGGDLMIPDGQRIAVTAPLTGTLLPADGQPVAVAGQRVTTNQILLRLTPMLAPERDVPNAVERVQMANARATLVSAQIQADGDVNQAQAQVEAAEIALARAKKLLSDKAGSRRAVDEADAVRNIAIQALEAAKERKKLLDTLTLEAETGTAPIVAIRSPHDGIVQIVATIGQVVSSGAPLFEIVDLDRLWVRVPVYAGQLDEIDATRDATIHGLADPNNNYSARKVIAPPTADPLAASIDLYYEVDNSDSRFRPGERVMVQLPMKGEAQSLVVPRAAILRDIYGTAWVYVRSSEHEFRRERASVQFTTPDVAVLSLGPEVGTPIVVNGAAELFGTEFGAGK